MIIGTCHFLDKASAICYYRPYHYEDTKRAVELKLRAGEIKLGPPECKTDETWFLNWNEGRYFKRING